MARLFLFADEAGDFSFKKKEASKYFIICTVVLSSGIIGAELLNLRRKLAWSNDGVMDFFHASNDKQYIRDQVFELISKHDDIMIQATIMEKSKAQSQTRSTDAQFYKYGWFYHMKYSKERYVQRCSELMLTIATIGTNKKKNAFEDALKEVLKQRLEAEYKNVFWRSYSDPCLQIADYCTWAIQRKWERGDSRSYDLIKDKITYEFDLWKHGTEHFY